MNPLNLQKIQIMIRLHCILLLTIWPLCGNLLAQETEIIAKVDQLFDAMRANDSTMVEGLFTDQTTSKTVFEDKNGVYNLRQGDLSGFGSAIGKPRSDKWDEKVWSYDVQIDGRLAYVWTEYTFYLNQKLLHCGYNMFELVKLADEWQISGITDTRRRNDCRPDPTDDINVMLDKWHSAAATADEETFYNSMTEDAIYIGTDASERWVRDEMKRDLHAAFEKETAWVFTAKERNIQINKGGKLAWFDEVLDTWMGDCRSTGIVVLEDNQWKIKHYQLSIAVPNETVDSYLKLIGKERTK